MKSLIGSLLSVLLLGACLVTANVYWDDVDYDKTIFEKRQLGQAQAGLGKRAMTWVSPRSSLRCLCPRGPTGATFALAYAFQN